jgi:hypothetical protein
VPTSNNPGPAASQTTNITEPLSNLLVIETLNVTMTPAAVATISTAEQSFGANGVTFVTAATGLLPGDLILAAQPPGSPLVAVSGMRVDAAVADKFYISFTNPTAGSLTPPAGVWQITVARKENSGAALTAVNLAN